MAFDPHPVPGEGDLAEILVCFLQCRDQRLMEILWSFKFTRSGGPLQEKQVGIYDDQMREKAVGKAGVSGEP